MAYIDKELFKQDIKMRYCNNCSHPNEIKCRVCHVDDMLGEIEDAPTADVAEVKRGYNKTSMHPVDEFYCSECGFCCADYTETKYDEDGDYTYSCECEFDYCPRCGAKMDKEKAQ